MIIKTFDPVTLKEKETISKVTSVIYSKRFYKVGSFEIQTTSDKFKENDIIAYSQNGRIRSGIVLKTFETFDGITVSGYDLKGLYGFRYMTAPSAYEGSPATILESMLKEYLCEGDRAIPNLVILQDGTESEGASFTPEQGYLDAAVESFGTANEIGTSVDFDLSGTISCKIFKGVDKSKHIKFSRQQRNIENIEYTKDLFNTYNVGYSVDENGNETITGSATGILRRECYKDKNIEEFLSEKAPVESLRAEANEKYRYGIDYELGDYVTVEVGNMSTVKQITEIKEVYEQTKRIIIPVFGSEKENPIKKILKGG